MKIKGLRWWMVGLITAGLVINYLARNTLSVAAPTMMKELNFGNEEYSRIVVAWQVCYAFMQPLAGAFVEALGTKVGFAIFAAAWSVACAAAALATGWVSLAGLRGVLGLTEAAGFPAAVRATTEWFPAKERSVAIGWFNTGSSIGALLAPPLVVWALLRGSWHWGFIIVGLLGLIWTVLWVVFYRHPNHAGALYESEREYIIAGQEAQFSKTSTERMSWGEMLGSRNFWSIGIPRILSEPAWQTLNAWIPLYMMSERHMNLKEVALFAWLPFLAADIGCVLGGYLSPIYVRIFGTSWLTSRKLVVLTGSLCMLSMAFVGQVASPYAAIALLCVGGFAHQTLSGGLYSVTTDLFGKNEVARATGLGGMMGFLGAAAFTALFGIMVTKVGYGPLFMVLAVFDLLAAVVVFVLARQPRGSSPPAESSVSGARSTA